MKKEKTRNGITYEFDTETNLFLNPETNKWVANPRNSIGKSITECISNFNYYEFALDFKEDEYTCQRINWFLTKLIKKYQQYYYLKQREVSVFEIDNSIVNIYFDHQLIKYLLTNKYKEYIQLLKKNGLITTVKKTSIYGYPLMLFNVTDKLLSTPKTKEKICFKKIVNSINNSYSHYYKSLDDCKEIFDEIKWININITKEKFDWEISNNHKYYASHCKENGKAPLNPDEYHNHMQYVYQQIIRWNEAPLKHRVEMCKQDTFGHRFHYLLTQVPKCIRKYSNDGYFNASFDLQCSQPTILAKFFLDNIGKNKFTDKLNACAENGSDIYYFFKDYFELKDRNSAKNKFIQLLYRENFDYDFDHQALLDYFGEAGEFFDRLKTERNDFNIDLYHVEYYKTPCRILQRMESRIFKMIWHELKVNGIKFYTCHDSVHFNDKDTVVVNQIMNEILKIELSGVNFKLKLE
jgi:hypothetical protein